MAITNGYCTLNEVKAVLGMGTAAHDDDTLLERNVEGASRRIDGWTDRQFYTDGSATARVYQPDNAWEVAVDDISTTSDLVVATDGAGDGSYSTTWTSSDYQLEPNNNLAKGEAVWRIRAVEGYFPTNNRRPSVQVTAIWGWPTVPDSIREACALLAARQFKRKDSLLGVAGFGDLGAITVRTIDPDVRDLISQYVRMRVA